MGRGNGADEEGDRVPGWAKAGKKQVTWVRVGRAGQKDFGWDMSQDWV